MPLPGQVSPFFGQIVDLPSLPALSQLIQQSYFPSGVVLPGSDFLGVVSFFERIVAEVR
jgi:hypothetical protein